MEAYQKKGPSTDITSGPQWLGDEHVSKEASSNCLVSWLTSQVKVPQIGTFHALGIILQSVDYNPDFIYISVALLDFSNISQI